MNDLDREPTGPADALEIIRAQQASTAAQLDPKMAWYFLIWGAVWLLSGVLYFLASTGLVAGLVAGIGTAAAIVAGLVSGAVIGIRSGRGVTGRSSMQGLLYGITWPIVMIALGALVGGLAGPVGLPDDTLGVVIPALFCFVTGALYALSGAVWTSWSNFVVGLWIVLLAVVSVYVGQPGNALVLGVGTGGALLAAGVRELRR